MPSTASASLHHSQAEVEGIAIHVVRGGTGRAPTVLFLHGWPESWAEFEQIMVRLGTEAQVVAIDLPGIGASQGVPRSGDKRTLARYVDGVIGKLGLQEVTLVGHDVGGMIVYAYLRAYPDKLDRAVIMNVALPGVDPWDEVKRNPHIWHFAFHAVPGLPEALVEGRQAVYFAYFYDVIAARPGAVAENARETYIQAYSRPQALHTGFEWYRAFAEDERANAESSGAPVRTPVVYLRGACEPGAGIETYVNGLRKAGLQDVRARVIPNSGHFAADEQPDEVLAALRDFMGLA